MHSTSPGMPCDLITHSTENCSPPSAVDSEGDSNRKFEKYEKCDVVSVISGDLSQQRIYDDPCELMGSNSTVFRMPRSRSWLCCPTEDELNQPTSTFNRVEYSYLVTEAPRPQFNHVQDKLFNFIIMHAKSVGAKGCTFFSLE